MAETTTTTLSCAWLDENPDWDVYARPEVAGPLREVFRALGRRDLERRVIAHRLMPEERLVAVDRTSITDEAIRQRVAQGLQEQAAEDLQRSTEELQRGFERLWSEAREWRARQQFQSLYTARARTSLLWGACGL